MTRFQSRQQGLLREWTGVLFLGLSIGLVGSGFSIAQDQLKAKSPTPSAGEKSIEEQLKEVERERDDLKRRNADLEQRLKQLQATVDQQVHQALGEPQQGARAYAFPPADGAFGRRPPGPFVSQFRPMFPAFGGMPDPVELAISYSDALGEKETAKPALIAIKQKVELGRGGSVTDVDAASARLFAAERKVRLLRSIVTTARAVAADNVERMQKLGAVRAVSAAEIRNAEATLKYLDEILESDPEAKSKPANPPAAVEPK
jgi:hypothetical protein